MDLTILARITALQAAIEVIKIEIIMAQTDNKQREIAGRTDVNYDFNYFERQAIAMENIASCLREF